MPEATTSMLRRVPLDLAERLLPSYERQAMDRHSDAVLPDLAGAVLPQVLPM